MPEFTHTCVANHRAISIGESSDVGYLDASLKTNSQSVTVQSSAVGWVFATNIWWMRHAIIRFDVRSYKGARATAVKFILTETQSTIDIGTMTLELRSYDRVNRNGQFDNTLDHYNTTEIAARTAYAEYQGLTDSGGIDTNRTLEFTNFGTDLLDLINASVSGDGIMDFCLVDDRMASGTPPPDNRTVAVSLGSTNRNYNWLTQDAKPPRMEITWEFEGEINVAQDAGVSVSDSSVVLAIQANWSDVLNGTATNELSVPGQNKGVGCYKDGDYVSSEFFIRFDFSSVDLSKNIKSVIFVLSSSGAPVADINSRPWHVRRHDWLGVPATSIYLGQSELLALDKVGEFSIEQDMLSADFPYSAPDLDIDVTKHYFDFGQKMIDAVNGGSVDTGFVIHSERMVTGNAPPETGGLADRFEAMVLAESEGAQAGPQIVILYEDNSLFFGSMF